MNKEEQAALNKFVLVAEAKGVPWHLCQGLGMYILFGIQPGDFLTAFMCHDLRGVMDHGDNESIAGLKPLWVFVYNNLPGTCWGSVERMEAWVKVAREKGAMKILELVGNC